MKTNEFLVVPVIDSIDTRVSRAVHREVVTNPTANERFLDLGKCINGMVDVEQLAVVGVEVAAWLRM